MICKGAAAIPRRVFPDRAAVRIPDRARTEYADYGTHSFRVWCLLNKILGVEHPLLIVPKKH